MNFDNYTIDEFLNYINEESDKFLEEHYELEKWTGKIFRIETFEVEFNYDTNKVNDKGYVEETVKYLSALKYWERSKNGGEYYGSEFELEGINDGIVEVMLTVKLADIEEGIELCNRVGRNKTNKKGEI